MEDNTDSGSFTQTDTCSLCGSEVVKTYRDGLLYSDVCEGGCFNLSKGKGKNNGMD